MKVLIADDHRLIVEGIRRALEGIEDIEVVGEANKGSQVLPLVRRLKPDVVLLDMRMPDVDGLQCLDQIRKSCPNVKAIMLSVFCDAERIQAAFRHGAVGYIVKSVNPVDLPSAIRQAVEGTVFHAFGSPEIDTPNADRRRPHRTGARHSEGGGPRPFELADRQGALGDRADRQVPPDEHLPEARAWRTGPRPPAMRSSTASPKARSLSTPSGLPGPVEPTRRRTCSCPTLGQCAACRNSQIRSQCRAPIFHWTTCVLASRTRARRLGRSTLRPHGGFPPRAQRLSRHRAT